MRILFKIASVCCFIILNVNCIYSQIDTVNQSPKEKILMGKSQSVYTAEPYWGIVKLTLRNGLITDINFMIRDSALHETFNEAYAKHFAGNELYIQQTRNDWNGVKTYPAKLKEKQDFQKVDVISGATWSYNIFKASVEEALKQGN